MSKPHHSYSTLTISYDGALATVTLNRPEKRNAISYAFMDDLLRVLEEVEQSAAQILILTGSGKAFCAGMDLEDLRTVASLTPEANHADSLRTTRLLRTLFVSLYKFPKVTIAAVNGPAIAGGCGLATLCDFTIAATEAKFGYTEVRIGFVPALVSTFLLRQVGEKQARDLLLDRQNLRRRRGPPAGAGNRGGHGRQADGACPRAGRHAAEELSHIACRRRSGCCGLTPAKSWIGSWSRRWKRMCASARRRTFVKA